MPVCSRQKHHITAQKPNSVLCCGLGEHDVFPHPLPFRRQGPPLRVKFGCKGKPPLCSHSGDFGIHGRCVLGLF